MKKQQLSIFFLALSLLLGLSRNSQATASPEFKTAPPFSVLARGAATPHELAKSIILAIQENNFTGLNAFLLEDKEIVLLKNKGSEDLKAFLENTSADALQNTLRQSYQELINQGVSQTINWSDFEVSDARLGKGSTKNVMLQPLTIILTDKQHQPLELILETVKLNKRYYLFRHIELKTPKKT